MQAQKFLELINHPEQLDKSTLEPLRELARKYPYSQPLRFLLAKNLQLVRHPDFEQQVNQAAAAAFDRRHFQAFLSDREKAPEPPAPQKASRPAHQERPASFSERIMGWFIKKGKNRNEEIEEKTVTPIEISEGISPVQEKSAPSDTQNTEAQPQRKYDELIDRFLKEEPRIKPRQAFSSNENLAEKNLVEPEDIGTETLAAIYAKQGLLEKALDIYQKLSLKFPEKSSYFAEKINSIKNEINLKK